MTRRRRGQFLPIIWQSVRQAVKALGKSARSIVARRSKPRTASNKGYSWTGQFMSLQKILNTSKKRPYANASRGFVLPSVILLLMLTGLVVGTMLSRSTSRATQVIAERSNQTVVNAASPAIDRAKAKLEFLFNKDPRFPGGLPGDALLQSMLLNTAPPAQPTDPYRLADETRIDINGDNIVDNAWSFRQDTNDDGQLETIAYSILVATNAQSGTVTRTSTSEQKSDNLVVRSGPVSMTQPGNGGCGGSITGATEVNSQGGWDAINSGTVKRSFQVTGVVINPKNDLGNRTVATLELQQDRQADLGNKWGAWFRNDLSIYPGPQFNWNGAMHTEGNLFATAGTGFKSYLISAPTSCLYRKENSEVTVAGNLDESVTIPDHPYLAQISAGSVRDNNFNGTTDWDIHGANGPSGTFSLSSTTDSVNSVPSNPDLIALDPIVLQTQDVSQSRASLGSPSKSDGSTTRNTNWKSSLPVTGGRIFNTSARAPYVDDTYRADNRYGPKSKYSSVVPSYPDVLPFTGTTINSSDTYAVQLTTLSTLTPEANGLDGYWERRSWAEGLRIIVGQRLELGNAYDWKKTTGDTISPDPLYPPITAALPTPSRSHELRQWKSLRDNLAAVQSAAIYHSSESSGGGGGFPEACLALTAHPGTQQTIANSLAFGNFPGTAAVQTNFLTGNGTNGWEFNPPATDAATFTTNLAVGQPLRKALTNLAYFAGDPNGAFPPQQYSSINTSVGNVVHPYPNLTMWGDYSNLRRVITQLNAGTTYANLSLADQTTLQTAACTLGMLSYNLEGISGSYTAALGGNGNVPNINSLGSTLFRLMDGIITPANPEIALNTSTPPYAILCTNTTATNCTGLATYSPNNYDDITSDQWIQALTSLQGSSTDPLVIYARQIFTQVSNYQQVLRDRSLGFARVTTPTTGIGIQAIPMVDTDTSSTAKYRSVPSGSFLAGSYEITNSSLPAGNATAIRGTGANAHTFRVFCDPDLFNMGTGVGVTPTTTTTSTYFNRLALAQAFCSPSESFLPRYPSLFYIFPRVDHTQSGGLPTSPSIPTANYDQGLVATQPSIGTNAEIYITDSYINGNSVNGAATIVYRAVQGGNVGISDSINQVAVQPRALNAWQLPNTTITAGRANLINNGGTAVSFLDKGIFNGREMMGVRVLDIDLDLLRRSAVNLTNDAWLPYTGIVYAFREDALREDGIARPAATTWSNCDSATEILTANCRMNAFTPRDPPKNDVTGVSPKPVDFYADPDRKPHGFRLRNGADVRRLPAIPSDNENALRGLSFISDNPVYVMADANNALNLHNDATTGTRIEEFTKLLSDDWVSANPTGTFSFYSRTGLNGNFARDGDTWRPVEIIADAVTILARTFVDGTIAEGIDRTDISGTSSYRTLNAPNDQTRNWVREDNSASDSGTASLPILISRDADPMYCVNVGGSDSGNLSNCEPAGGTNYRLQAYGRENNTVTIPGTTTTLPIYTRANSGTNRSYMTFNDNKGLAVGVDGTRMNFTVVSGITPARAGSDYGGLHNFPRFLNDWQNSLKLYLSGSFIQLNFSTSATAPFDQDAWEPGGSETSITSTEYIKYYSPPARRWGYDVGLQYSPAGPVARRFSTPSNTKSEFYTTLPIDDAYVKQIRCAKSPPSTGPRIDPTLSATDCT